jgi:CBS domain-containing protein
MPTVRDLMVLNPLTVAPDDTLRSAAEMLTEARIGGAPVVSDGLAIGIVTLTDIVAFAAEEPDATVVPVDLADLVPEGEPEVGADGLPDPASEWFRSIWDVQDPDAPLPVAEVEVPGWSALDDHTVAEVMSRVLVHVAATTPLDEAARIMERARIHRLIVLENGAAAGILTSFDLVKAVASGRLVAAEREPALG